AGPRTGTATRQRGDRAHRRHAGTGPRRRRRAGAGDAADRAAGMKSGAAMLLVEDDETFRGVLRRALERRGYRVSVAASAEEAIDLAGANPPDYAVVDLKLPGDSGLAVVAALKNRHPQT